MKGKITFLTKAAALLFVALFSLTGARADQTGQLTVYDRNQTSGYVPAYFAGFGNATQLRYGRSQFIIPSNQLTAMNGNTITGIRFYATWDYTNTTISLPAGKVYVKEVNTTTFGNNPSFVTDCTTVFEGELYIVKATGELRILFTTPYTYNGGNLLIGFENTGRSSYTDTFGNTDITFYGQQVTNTACYGTGNTLPTRGTRTSFIPKTTFTYLIPDQYAVPSGIKATQVGPYDANISWEGNANSYNLRYGEVGTITAYNFDNSQMGGWTTIDADGDGFNWAINTQDLTYRSYNQPEGLGYNGSTDMVISGSFCSNSNDETYSGKPLFPDNYLVSPSLALGGTISFWAKGMDAADCAEVFGVAVSTSGNTNAANFTMVGETKTATAEWTLYSFDLSEYEGQNGYVAIRHFNCTDQDLLCVDDIEISAPGGALTTITGIADKNKALKELEKLTDYQVSVQAVYSGGTSAWAGVRFTTTNENPVPAEVVVDPIAEQTATITWYGISDSYVVNYRSEVKDGQQYFFEDFEGGLTEKGWTVNTQGETVGNLDGWHDFLPAESSYKFTAVSGTKAVRALSWGGSGINADNWLITPKVTIGKMLKFWVRTNPGYPDDYTVLLSTTGTAISNFTVTLQAKTAAPAVNGWSKISIEIPDQYVDTDGYIAIHHEMYDGNYLVIDDFGMFGPDVAPESVGWETAEVNNAEPGYNHVDLTGLVPNTTYEYQIIGYMEGEEPAITTIATFTTEGMDVLELVDNADNTPTIEALHGLVNVDVKLMNRTLKADTWNTLCLPCNVKLTGGKLDGVSVDVRKLAGAELDGTTMNLNFESVTTELVAGTPYIIKPESAITNPVFEKALVRKGENFPSFTLDGDDIKVSFKGTYKPISFTATDKSILFLRNGSFYYPVNNSYINSQRAYLQLTGIHAGKPAPAPTKEFTFKNNLDDDPTAIAELFGLTEDNGAWYDLNGRKLAEKPVQKGIYINNGKKTIIK